MNYELWPVLLDTTFHDHPKYRNVLLCKHVDN